MNKLEIKLKDCIEHFKRDIAVKKIQIKNLMARVEKLEKLIERQKQNKSLLLKNRIKRKFCGLCRWWKKTSDVDGVEAWTGPCGKCKFMSGRVWWCCGVCSRFENKSEKSVKSVVKEN